MCLFKERNRNLAGDDAEVGSIRSLEELVEHALFLRGQIQVRVSLCYSMHLGQSRLIQYPGVGLYKGQRIRDEGAERLASGAPGGTPELRQSYQRAIASGPGTQDQGLTHEYQPWLCVERDALSDLDSIRIVGSLGRSRWRHGEAVSLAGRGHEHGLDQAQLQDGEYAINRRQATG